jgi:glycosyltransferase involved in cell wall biosynthesis
VSVAALSTSDCEVLSTRTTDSLRGAVSVVIPCYNAESWIARAIRSVLGQRNGLTDIIVIDDGSTDGSLEIIRSFGERVVWRTGPNQGVGAARNRGLALARGEFILFLDADDYLEPGSIREWAANGEGADLVFGPFVFETGAKRIPGHSMLQSASVHSLMREWLAGRFTPPCSVLWRRSFLLDIGAWNAKLLRNEDGELVMRGLLNGARVNVAGHGLGVYRQHEYAGRVSKRKGRKVLVSELDLFEDLLKLAEEKGGRSFHGIFALAFYHIAYEAFATGIDDVGYLALSRARQLGLKGYPGPFAHRTLSSILGMRNKLRITGLIKRRAMKADLKH